MIPSHHGDLEDIEHLKVPFLKFTPTALQPEVQHCVEVLDSEIESTPFAGIPQNKVSPSTDTTVLVVNASREMATEITRQLTRAIPGCALMYAPSIEISKLLISRRAIDLVVSSPVLPDGSVQRLAEMLAQHPAAPDLVVIGDNHAIPIRTSAGPGYRMAGTRLLNQAKSTPVIHRRIQTPSVDERVRALGADIRNDLNNPLQAIVAMVFVAKASSAESPLTAQALDAIDQAAKNMARVVTSLEGKILEVVDKPATAKS